MLLGLFQPLSAGAADSVVWQQEAGVYQQELAMKQGLQQQAERLLLSGKFAELEALASKFRASKEMFSDGEWKLSVFYDGMSYYLRTASEENWEQRLKRLKQWVAENPDSVTAHVALAECEVGYAFFGRSYGWSKDVSQSQWQLFDDRLEEATQALLAVQEHGTRCPGWLAAFQRIALSGWEREPYERLFQQAIANEPTYTAYYFRKAWHLMPRWFGEPGEWEAFAEISADRLGGVAGDMLYARIVWFLDRRGPYHNMARQPESIDWPRVHRGLKAIKNGSVAVLR
ncbi:MAG: hypothetical protein AUJ55_11030 [Proteobacteria bacterium CG1_02_64_396]|nr:MAG: hypothetical protein AUJ55_11030 [Proteobacteria bacterium CG1_02_64_396]